MMTTEQIGELARHFKIDEASIIREYVQLLFLRSFYALKESRNVFFKGGTAIHEKMKWYGKDYRQEDLTEIIAAAKEKDLYNDLARFLPKHYRQTITDLKKNILQKLGQAPPWESFATP